MLAKKTLFIKVDVICIFTKTNFTAAGFTLGMNSIYYPNDSKFVKTRVSKSLKTVKHLASTVSSIFFNKKLYFEIWCCLPATNSLILSDLVVNELKKTISHNKKYSSGYPTYHCQIQSFIITKVNTFTNTLLRVSFYKWWTTLGRGKGWEEL